MSLPDFSIKKPVTTVMIFIGVMLFGVISLVKLQQELFPPITYPQLTVFTSYANAAPEEVETLLTRPIEEAVGTVSGLKSIQSISKEGSSLVIGEFDWDQNMDFASLRTREKVDLVKARLPRDSAEPLVVPFNPFEMPIMTISVTGNRPPVQLRQIATDIIKEELEKVDGVASASVEGGLEREIIIDVDQGKLTTHGVSILEVSDAITNANLNYPAGTIKESFYEYLIRTLGEFRDIQEIKDVVVKSGADEAARERAVSFEQTMAERKISHGSNLVLVKDVAEIRDTFKERSSFSRFNKDENISISIQKQAQANTIQVINKVRDSIPRFKKILPGDIKLKITYDQSVFIRSAINGVRDAAWQGGILAFLVLLVFLRNATSSAIVTLSIPISIMVTFTCMYFSGLSINMMSLGGLALGVGMLVDNGIVVIENIFRHNELGESSEEAAVKGANEVIGAITASTLTTIAVFLPMIFIIGVAGQIFKELSFTVTFSLCASIWVALTLIPLLSCKLGGKGRTGGGTAAFAGGKKWKAFLEKFEIGIRKFLKYKGIGLLIIFGVFVASLFLMIFLKKELMPKADQGQFILKVDMRVGTKLTETDKAVRRMEERILTYPEVLSASSIVGSTQGSSAKDVMKRMGSHQGQIMVDLKDKRKRATNDIVQFLEKDFKEDKELKDARIEFVLQQGVVFGAFGGGGKAIVIEVKGDRLDIMENIVRRIEEELAKIQGIFGVKDDVPEPAPEVRINIDKDKAALYNISVVDLAKAAQTVLRGFIPSQFKEKGHEIDIRVRLRETDRDSYDKLYHVRISSPGGQMVPLGTLAGFEKGKGPSEIKRIRQERTIMVFADCFGRNLSNVNKEIENMLKRIKIESGYRVKLAGESEEMKKSFNSMIFALVLSIVLVYMIMAAQFESIIQPLIILFTVPLSIIGVIGILFVTGRSINIISLLGVLVLGGVVVNNAIVLIDFTNVLMREKGKSAFDAIVEASCARLRPILMTALTTILGLIPMAIAAGKGSELSSPMAISIMGGLTVSTFLTLGVVPAVFMYDQEIRAKLRKQFAKGTIHGLRIMFAKSDRSSKRGNHEL